MSCQLIANKQQKLQSHIIKKIFKVQMNQSTEINTEQQNQLEGV
jgi:hypothetical protein